MIDELEDTQRLPVLKRIRWLRRFAEWLIGPRVVVVTPALPMHTMPKSVPFSLPSAIEQEKLEILLNAVMFQMARQIQLITDRRLSPAEIDTLRHSLRGAFNQARQIGMLHANDGKRAMIASNIPRSQRLTRQQTENLDANELAKMIAAAELTVPKPRGKV